MAEKAHAFTRNVIARADADVIKDAVDAERVHGKSPAADFARDFLEDIMDGFLAGRDAKDAGLLKRGRR
jgi:hypothetical protein